MSDETNAPVAPAAVSEATTTVVETPNQIKPEVITDGQTAAADAKVVVTGPPETYAWKAPEGFEDRFDTAALDLVAKEAKALGLSQEDAQAYLNASADRIKAEETAREASWKATTDGWANEVKTDPKLGGANFEKTQSRLNAVVARFGDDSVKELFDSTGLGNHPALCRMLAGIGAVMEQDKFVSGDKPVAQPLGPQSMYPNSPELK